MLMLGGAIAVCYAANWAIDTRAENISLNKENLNLTAKVSLQSALFQRLNTISVEAKNAKQNETGQSQVWRTINRTVFKTEDCAAKPVPRIYAERLHSLVATYNAGMLPHSGGSDATRTYPLASSDITYQQAVEWLEPLIVLIHEQNIDKQAIRQVDSLRLGTVEK
jgi:hypothetical protein